LSLPHPIIPITDPIALDDHEAINALCETGCALIHLRKPGWSQGQLGHWLEGIQQDFHQRLTLHGSEEIAAAFGCGGWHGPASGALSSSTGLRRSSSWHALDEPHDAVDYGFMSPIWPSTSKPGYGPAWSTAELTAAIPRWTACVVALGGVTPERCAVTRDMGFAGAAVLGWLWSSFAPAEVVARWQELEKAWAID
jgi:thiamine-phosphate pyrophosphorylase